MTAGLPPRRRASRMPLLRFASLGSGSRGNALVVESAGGDGCTRLLLDCGFGPRELIRRLARLGLAGADLDAILVTHEHGDHSAGVFACARRFGLPVFLSHGTLAAVPRNGIAPPAVHVIDSHRPFRIGAVEIHPFPVPHDAREPVQYVFAAGAHRLGVLTDAGAATPHISSMLSGCQALVLECNHDAGMLARGRYPRHLKQRIAGPYGHLENNAAAELLSLLDRSGLRHLVAAHISQENNTPQLACRALAQAGGYAEDWVCAASQDEGFPWRTLE